ncbi:MAG: DUF503 domain-containing protein [Acidobacteria bacterium]|jgi:uncharacterized protein YlxP (DUF503 family)|nr:MAG: DUF503 domain-containing protein [Acidobacteriota bacterium]
MVLGILSVELFFPENGSLKEKRQYLRSIKDRVRSSLNVSVAEIDHHELWQRAQLAFACVAVEKAIAEDTIQKAIKLLDRHYPEFIIGMQTNYLKL